MEAFVEVTSMKNFVEASVEAFVGVAFMEAFVEVTSMEAFVKAFVEVT